MRLTVLTTKQINGMNKAPVKLRRPSQARNRRPYVRPNSTNPSVAAPSALTHLDMNPRKTLILLICISLNYFFIFLKKKNQKKRDGEEQES